MATELSTGRLDEALDVIKQTVARGSSFRGCGRLRKLQLTQHPSLPTRGLEKAIPLGRVSPSRHECPSHEQRNEFT